MFYRSNCLRSWNKWLFHPRFIKAGVPLVKTSKCLIKLDVSLVDIVKLWILPIWKRCFVTLFYPCFEVLLKHVKAWLKPNLHKIPKAVLTLPGFGFNLCRTGSLTNLDDLNIIRRIKSDKISYMTINVFYLLEEQLKMDLLDDMLLTINAFQKKKSISQYAWRSHCMIFALPDNKTLGKLDLTPTSWIL